MVYIQDDHKVLVPLQSIIAPKPHDIEQCRFFKMFYIFPSFVYFSFIDLNWKTMTSSQEKAQCVCWYAERKSPITIQWQFCWPHDIQQCRFFKMFYISPSLVYFSFIDLNWKTMTSQEKAQCVCWEKVTNHHSVTILLAILKKSTLQHQH